MTNNKFFIFVLLIGIILSTNVYAEVIIGSPEKGNACGDNCSWSFDTESATLTITGTGPMNDWQDGDRPWESYIDLIQNISIANGITSIGNYAFEGNGESILSSITIPDSVTSIGEDSFAWTPITSIIIPESVSFIDDYAFEGISATIYCFSDICENKMSNNIEYYTKQNGQYILSDGSVIGTYDIQQGATKTVKRIYTPAEAAAVVKPTGNTFKIRYR